MGPFVCVGCVCGRGGGHREQDITLLGGQFSLETSVVFVGHSPDSYWVAHGRSSSKTAGKGESAASLDGSVAPARVCVKYLFFLPCVAFCRIVQHHFLE